MFSVFKKACFASTLALVAVSALWAQSPRRPIHGKVLDASHTPLSDAAIVAISEKTKAETASATDPKGEFVLQLEPGTYTLRVSKKDFASVAERITVTAQSLQLHDITLPVAGASDTITVTETAPESNYQTAATSSATKTLTDLRDVPQSVSVVTKDQIQDQMMLNMGDVVRYIPGITEIQGENNRDQLVIRGNSTSADFYVDGVRDDVQYYRDLYDLDRVEALKGPNAMIFGRGGAGGVINRVTKVPSFTPQREITLDGGSFGDGRVTVDLDQPLGAIAAFRVNGMYENSGTFRDFVGLHRFGIAPSLSIAPSNKTMITFEFEHFRDLRGSDRGIPSYHGLPVDVPVNQFFGNPDYNDVHARVDIGTINLEQQIGPVHLRNHTLIGNYDRGYQNVVPGAVTPDGLQDSLSGYNNATARLNAFNQTDLSGSVKTWGIRHTLLGGVEIGQQWTDNFRNTAFFNNTSTTLLVPLTESVINTTITFRQSATDANNHLLTKVAAVYAQDQIELSKYVQVVAGLRFDDFNLSYHDNRSDASLQRIDNLVSPRAGIIVKPVTALSIYGSYSVSYLPSSGDQFSSLTTITQQVQPEKFNNYEAGVKWEVAKDFSLTTAVYRLDRTNTRSTDPNDPTRIVQTGSQRTNGFEVGLNGNITSKWRIAGGYAYQDAFVTSATTAAAAGQQVAQVPHHTCSLWNNYQVTRKFGAGLGVIQRSDMFAAIDDTVTLPGYVRADAAFFYSLTEKMRLQVNVENLFNTKYVMNADNNTNISPGSPIAARVGIVARF